jgi:hypothetical protein
VKELKKTQVVLLAITAILALSSAYALSAINQVYNIKFEWYSQYNKNYEALKRDVSNDKFHQPVNKPDIKLGIVENAASLQNIEANFPNIYKSVIGKGLLDNIYIYCSLGKVSSPEYRIKVVSIAQRGNNVEIKVSINTPELVNKDTDIPNDIYSPIDLAKIPKDALPSKGVLYFVFKDQDGRQLYQEYCYVW